MQILLNLVCEHFSALFLDFVCIHHKALAVAEYLSTQVFELVVWIACGNIRAKLFSNIKCDRHFSQYHCYYTFYNLEHPIMYTFLFLHILDWRNNNKFFDKSVFS